MPRIKRVRPHVVVYEVEYEWSGAADDGDQYADGDHEGASREVISCMPDREDIEDGRSWVELALAILNDQPAYLEPDCSPVSLTYAPSWFGGSGEPSYRDGSWQEYSVHLYGFTALERVEIARRYASEQVGRAPQPIRRAL
jgi:hypothetical protein